MKLTENEMSRMFQLVGHKSCPICGSPFKLHEEAFSIPTHSDTKLGLRSAIVFCSSCKYLMPFALDL